MPRASTPRRTGSRGCDPRPRSAPRRQARYCYCRRPRPPCTTSLPALTSPRSWQAAARSCRSSRDCPSRTARPGCSSPARPAIRCEHRPAMSIDGSGTERARCVLAPNPSPMTLDGTNTWVIAEPGSAQAVVVDPGPDDESHLRRVYDQVTAAGQQVARILLTHSHPDHAEGAATFAGMTGAPVQAADPAYRLGAEGLAPGDTITASGCEIH